MVKKRMSGNREPRKPKKERRPTAAPATVGALLSPTQNLPKRAKSKS